MRSLRKAALGALLGGVAAVGMSTPAAAQISPGTFAYAYSILNVQNFRVSEISGGNGNGSLVEEIEVVQPPTNDVTHTAVFGFLGGVSESDVESDTSPTTPFDVDLACADGTFETCGTFSENEFDQTLAGEATNFARSDSEITGNILDVGADGGTDAIVMSEARATADNTRGTTSGNIDFLATFEFTVAEGGEIVAGIDFDASAFTQVILDPGFTGFVDADTQYDVTLENVTGEPVAVPITGLDLSDLTITQAGLQTPGNIVASTPLSSFSGTVTLQGGQTYRLSITQDASAIARLNEGQIVVPEPHTNLLLGTGLLLLGSIGWRRLRRNG